MSWQVIFMPKVLKTHVKEHWRKKEKKKEGKEGGRGEGEADRKKGRKEEVGRKERWRWRPCCLVTSAELVLIPSKLPSVFHLHIWHCALIFTCLSPAFTSRSLTCVGLETDSSWSIFSCAPPTTALPWARTELEAVQAFAHRLTLGSPEKKLQVILCSETLLREREARVCWVWQPSPNSTLPLGRTPALWSREERDLPSHLRAAVHMDPLALEIPLLSTLLGNDPACG